MTIRTQVIPAVAGRTFDVTGARPLVASPAVIKNLSERGQRETIEAVFIKESGPTWVNSPRPKSYEVVSNGVSVITAFEASAKLNG